MTQTTTAARTPDANITPPQNPPAPPDPSATWPQPAAQRPPPRQPQPRTPLRRQSAHHRLPLPRPRHAQRPLPHARRQKHRPAHAKGLCRSGRGAHQTLPLYRHGPRDVLLPEEARRPDPDGGRGAAAPGISAVRARGEDRARTVRAGTAPAPQRGAGCAQPGQHPMQRRTDRVGPRRQRPVPGAPAPRTDRAAGRARGRPAGRRDACPHRRRFAARRSFRR